jgi:integrase
MGTVHAIRQDEAATLAAAAAAFLDTLDHPETRGTRRAYASTLRALRAEFGDDTVVADLEPVCVGTWFAQRWGSSAPATWNRNLDAVRSAQGYWRDQRWMTGVDLTGVLRRRKRAADRSRALSRADVEALLTRDDVGIREKTLWRLLYETAARSAEVLRLDVEDLDLANRRAKVTRKGGAVDVIVWQTGTARLLPRLLKGRKTGPVFLTGRRARVQLPPCDIDPASGRARLSYRQAEDLFKAASGGATLHQLRHSALTHDAEHGASTPMLMAKSGHTSVASLARYARPSAEALARWQERNDPARRR